MFIFVPTLAQGLLLNYYKPRYFSLAVITTEVVLPVMKLFGAKHVFQGRGCKAARAAAYKGKNAQAQGGATHNGLCVVRKGT